eukprot:CAMPEP_0118682516 /NCGR_PEP_ID=MMETSP0800-20121206/5526_1 /TAXON_ID=210618 ORGANISM="Striatella unipunctata, Strain CCMP2910" /NCGR_SAMPLE_ID=MMETSP0800 /ASSEMBLY_ACC=CAM_ASM_000638 /LENGTH=318 /DNA_ID=CAMNT_0006578909 /DNA_START=310 /DNA_END=1266 /DNA_ORIENTATION=+
MTSSSLSNHKCSFENLRGGHVASPTTIKSVVDGAANTPYGIPLFFWKIMLQCVLTAINVTAWLVPLNSRSMRENPIALAIANNFSAGVFLSMAFAHLIPECVHGFSRLEKLPTFLSYWMVLVGYLIIFFVEKVAFDPHAMLHHQHTDDHHHHHHSEEKDDKATLKQASHGASAMILLGALSIHSLLEMSALGLASNFRDAALMTMSIGLHQPAESIALLVAFLKAGMPKDRIVRLMSMFAFMDFVGVAIGMAVNEFAPPIVDAIMVGIVAGTFVYVGATELIPEEWEEKTWKWRKFGAFLGGIVTIGYVTQYSSSLGF